MSKSFVKGALILTICGLIGKVIGAFYRIPFALIVGAEGVGLYQLVYPLYTLMLTLASGGLPTSISKILSEQWAAGEYSLAKKTFKFSMLLLVAFSIIASLLIVLFSYPVAKLQGNISAFGCYLAISPAVLFVGIISGLRGYFQAKENMTPTAVSNLIEQVLKVAFGLLLAKLFLPKGIVAATIGALVGVTISEVAAFVFMAICYAYSSKKFTLQKLLVTPVRQSNKQILGKILSIAMPIALGSIIMPISLLIDSALVVKLLSTHMDASQATGLFGLQAGIVGSLSNLPVVAAIGVATAILPQLSKQKASGELDALKGATKNAFLFVLLVSIPCAIVYYFFAPQMIGFLYGHTFSEAEKTVCVGLLKIGAFNIIALSVAQVSASVLQGLGHVKVPVFSLIAGAISKIVSICLLVRVPSIGIYGAEISDIICFAVASIINIVFIYKEVAAFGLVDSLVVGLFSGVVGVVSYFASALTSPALKPVLSLLVGGGITFVIYIALLLLVVFAKRRQLHLKRVAKTG